MLPFKTIDFNSYTRSIECIAECYNSANTLVNTFTKSGALKSVNINRSGEGKFFGFGVCQELKLELLDKDRAINIDKSNRLRIIFDGVKPFAHFYPDKIDRDENTNNLTITAYDVIYKAADHTVAELELVAPYNLFNVATACARLLGLSGVTNTYIPEFELDYPEGANLEGTETIRSVLDDIAEATHSIYYVNAENELVFKHFKPAEVPVLTIGKASYFTLKSKENRTLSTLVSATELGDNISVTTGASGETQYLRDNPFLELRADLDMILENVISTVGGLSINEFECEWRGNYLLEIGDKIALVTKDNNTITSYVINDSISYDGGLKQKTNWSYSGNEAETASNPTSLGEALKYTFAKVDKANREIQLAVSEIDGYTEKITNLELTTDSIRASVNNVDNELTKLVNTTITSEELEIAVKNEVANGVDKITTTTGFTFNEEGLTVSKSGVEMVTQITEDGVKVFRDSNEVLTADNGGVKAEDLHATTFLIIGENSRLEDYDNKSRTGCFWIG